MISAKFSEKFSKPALGVGLKLFEEKSKNGNIP
jgi:hypothetical protein